MKDSNWMKRFWNFLKDDSWPSVLVSLVLAFLIIKFILFPLLSLATGTALPLVIVESCSMYHSDGLQEVLQNPVYQEYGITDASGWSFRNGINKGDIIFVVGPKNIRVGDVIIFGAGTPNPIIHRVIRLNDFITTKGDHNSALLQVEQQINPNQVLGKAVFRIPYLGWIKLIFFDWMKPASERGFCS
jgi:signal peptidase I